MTCSRITLPDGTVALVKHAPVRQRLCKVCHRKTPAALQRLCDWKHPSQKTCDLLMCADCATSIGPDQDLCPDHARLHLTRNPV